MNEEQGTTDTATADVTATTDVTTPTSYIGEDGNFTDGWIDKYVPEANRSDAIFGRTKSIQGAMSMLANFDRMKGADTVAKPSESFGDTDWDDFHKAGGWTGEAPQLDIPEGLPKELWSDDRAGKFSDGFNKLRLNPTQVAGIMDMYSSDLMEQYTNQGNNTENSLAELKSTLLAEKGNAYAQFQHNGNFAIEKGTAGETSEFKQRIIDKYGSDPDLVRLLGNLGGNFAEAGAIPKNEMKSTPSDINAEIAKIQNSDAWKNKRNPEHATAMKTIARLYKERAVA